MLPPSSLHLENEDGKFSETLVSFHSTTWYHNLEDTFNLHHCEYLISNLNLFSLPLSSGFNPTSSGTGVAAPSIIFAYAFYTVGIWVDMHVAYQSCVTVELKYTKG
jgi:hypothetical protein